MILLSQYLPSKEFKFLIANHYLSYFDSDDLLLFKTLKTVQKVCKGYF